MTVGEIDQRRAMFALTFHEYGEPDVVGVSDDFPEPHPGAGEVRIKVRSASINPIDWKIMSGALAGGDPLDGPGLLGHDAAGVVDEMGDGVTDVQVGDDVFGRGSATQAEFAVLNAWAPKPASVDWSMAAAAGVAMETAERVLRLLGVKAGDVLFVAGGSGGVGSVAVQVAVARGLTVIASASEANHDYLREIGAVPVTYGDGLVERVQAVTPEPIDAVLDVTGKTPVEDLISLAPQPSQVVSIANFGAAESGIRVTGGGADSQPFQALREGAELLEQGKLVVKVQTFPFDRAAEAYRLSKEGHVRGKLVLIPETAADS
jgi:NADPH:quinone reductase-like Zn-dependent oxidoreductase